MKATTTRLQIIIVMGITVFICKVRSKEAVKKAIRAIIHHNTTPAERLGGSYTEEEFERLDPKRARMMKLLVNSGRGRVTAFCMQRWNRGEDIRDGGCFVVTTHDGAVWLEVANGGGGAHTTLWLQKNYPEMGWKGTDGKPAGFYESPSFGASDSFGQLVQNWAPGGDDKC